MIFSFTQHNVFKVHLCHCVYKYLTPFYCQVIFHCVCVCVCVYIYIYIYIYIQCFSYHSSVSGLMFPLSDY
jgi:hypothetical protein